MQTAARAAGEMSQSVQFIASSCEETTATMREVATHAADASSMGQRAVSLADAAASTMAGLQGASEQARDVLTMISGVAKQTHLLALNATIEAARAGDNGTGFAVVASEVKELAGQTAQGSGKVGATVRDIGRAIQTYAEGEGYGVVRSFDWSGP